MARTRLQQALCLQVAQRAVGDLAAHAQLHGGEGGRGRASQLCGTVWLAVRHLPSITPPDTALHSLGIRLPHLGTAPTCDRIATSFT